MWKNEGILSFWKGNGANVMKIAPESAIKFYANEIFKEHIAEDPRSVQPHERLLYRDLVLALTAHSLFDALMTCRCLSVCGYVRGVVVKDRTEVLCYSSVYGDFTTCTLRTCFLRQATIQHDGKRSVNE